MRQERQWKLIAPELRKLERLYLCSKQAHVLKKSIAQKRKLLLPQDLCSTVGGHSGSEERGAVNVAAVALAREAGVVAPVDVVGLQRRKKRGGGNGIMDGDMRRMGEWKSKTSGRGTWCHELA